VDLIERRELKYYVPIVLLDALRDRIMTHMEYDPHCLGRKDFAYPVHSLYLDTRRSLFYFEKIEGHKVRKKLRIRIYEPVEIERTAFLEIKRKINEHVFKERVQIPIDEALQLFNGVTFHPLNCRNGQALALDRFVYLTKRLQLEPKVLIVYDREAFFDPEGTSLRVTFDMNIRSSPTDDLEDLLSELDCRPVSQQYFIMEVKFSGIMPHSIKRIINDFRLRLQSYSKYCEGLDVWQAVPSALGPNA